MATPNANLQPETSSAARHGNTAQLVSAGAAILAVLVAATSITLTLWFHHTASQSQTDDEHIKGLITEKIQSPIADLTGKVGDLAVKIGKLEGRFEQLDSEQKKATKLQLNKLEAEVAIALRSKKDIDPTIVSQIGEDLLTFAKSGTPELSQAAWRATTVLSDYRSFLNSRHGPDITNATSTKPKGAVFETSFFARKLPDAKNGTLGVLYFPDEPLVAGSQSAMFIEIGKENEVVRAPRKWVVVGDGFEIVLDRYHVRNTIVRDAHIIYNGGPLILENVYFVNCTFNFKNTSNSQQLAYSIVTQLPSSFKVS